MTRTDGRRLKTPASLLGAGALIAMGIIGVAASWGDGGHTSVVSGGTMTTGETTTVTFSGTITPVKAVPAVKAKPFGEG